MTTPYMVNKTLAKHGVCARIERDYATKSYKVFDTSVEPVKEVAVIKGPNLHEELTSHVVKVVTELV